MQEAPLGAQISLMLKDRGVDVIFGIPGVHNQEMYRGIEAAGITHVLARHEQGAGFMADGYARASGKPGVAYVITGPGLTNAMTPMGQAYSDSVPLLVISSCLDETAATRGQLHQMKDQRAAAETVCDWSQEARSAAAAYALIDRAFYEFEAARPRTKHIQVPIAALEARAEGFIPRGCLADSPPAKASLPVAEIDALARRLMQAERPLFIFGGGARYVPPALVSRILQATGAASFVTYAGRGTVPPGTGLSFGATLARPDSAAVLAQSDCAVCVGTDLAEVDLWRSETGLRPGATHINIDPERLAATHPDDTRLRGDASVVLDHLAQAFTGPAPSRWQEVEIAKYRDRWRAEIDAERPGILPVCEALRAAIPRETMIYSDITQFAYAAKEVWEMDRPGHWHHPTGFGTLGYATPAAIGGAVARPGLPTMAIIGDYGFHYTMAELGVAVELGLPLPIFLWDNGKLKEIEESMVRAQIAPNAVVARNPDFCRLAEAFGARATAPKDLAALQTAMRDAFAAAGPTLIYVTADIAL